MKNSIGKVVLAPEALSTMISGLKTVVGDGDFKPFRVEKHFNFSLAVVAELTDPRNVVCTKDTRSAMGASFCSN